MDYRVLIVDDSSMARSLVKAALEEMNGFDIVECANGFEALKILPQMRFDLVFADINMPEINGLELISFIRHTRSHREVPLVIITTESGAEDRARGLRLGANEYLVKPLDPINIQEVARKYLK